MTNHSSPVTEQGFDAMCDLFTSYAHTVADWQQHYYGATYSTRLKAAIADMKFAIAEAEKHPEIGPVSIHAQTTPKAVSDALLAATLSACGRSITIDCSSQEVRDIIYDWIEGSAVTSTVHEPVENKNGGAS